MHVHLHAHMHVGMQHFGCAVEVSAVCEDGWVQCHSVLEWKGS